MEVDYPKKGGCVSRMKQKLWMCLVWGIHTYVNPNKPRNCDEETQNW